jgi:hypothetical protein
MTIYLRFSDLKARGVVKNWTTLQHWINNYGFPPGRMMGPNIRAWSEDEVESYIAKRPTARKKVPMPNKNKKGKAA